MSGQDELPQALERLVALGQSPDVNIRPVLLRVVVDMFVNKAHHAAPDLQQFEAIAQHLLDDAEPEARLIVADKLAKHPQTPKSLLDRFVAEEGSIASKVYEHAALDEPTLTAAARWSSASLALAVARRSDVPPETLAALAERPEPEIMRAIAGNTSATIDRTIFQRLIRHARDDRELASNLAARAIDPLDLAPIFGILDGGQRAAVINAARRAELGRRQWGRLDAAPASDLDRMDRLTRGGDRDGFDTALCLALGIDPDLLLPLVHDAGGEALALALAATGATPDLAARVFILGDPRIGRSISRVRALVDIVESVSTQAARRLVMAMTGAATAPKRRTAVEGQGAAGRRLDHGVAQEQAPRREPAHPMLARKLG